MCLFFVLFKQKTAYEMRISDWSSDVCSSDLGIVDEDADRKDQREQADAVDRVAHAVGGEHGEQDRRGNDDRRDRRLAPADGATDERRDGNRADAEVEEQLVRLLVRRLAVVARGRQSTRMNASHYCPSRMPSPA